jgi:hypothetical protein
MKLADKRRKRLDELVGAVMSNEARNILILSDKYRPSKNSRPVVYPPSEKILAEIRELLKNLNGISVEELECSAIKYLDSLIAYATQNPSYAELKRRILAKEYDIAQKLGINQPSNL